MLCFSFSNENKISSFNKGNFKRILITVLHNNFLSFDGKSWKQIDGVAMGSLLGPSLSNTFYVLMNKYWWHICFISFTRSSWKIYKLFKF